MNFTYVIILVAVLVISPFVLKLASNQGEKAKYNLKLFFISILSAQFLLGLLNWENFTSGRSGFELALSYPQSVLGIFFIISLIQFFLLIAGKKLSTFVVILNFINTVVIFIGMIRLSNILGFQAASLSSIGTVFLVLAGNVVGLVFINKDKNLLKKYFR